MRSPNVIDLSHHNTLSSLRGAKDAGVWGVIHKLTEGTGFRDSQAKHHIPLIREADLLVGLYHFIRPGNIDKQIDHFLANAIPYIDDYTLLCCDFEDAGVSLADVLHFLTIVEHRTYRSPVLYGGSVLKEAVKTDGVTAKRLTPYRFWLAQYGPTAKLPKGFDKLWLWQYSETGKMAGIAGNVDLNYFAGTQDELEAQWSGKQVSAAQSPATQDQPSNPEVKPSVRTDPAADISEFKAEITPEGGVKVQSNQGPPTPKERVAVVKASPQGWYTVVGAKITAFVTGNALFQWVWGQISTLSSFQIPVEVWYAVSGIVLLGSLMWIIDAILDNHKANTINNETDQLLVTQNSTPDNLVQLIPANEVDLYRAKGFKIITRGETSGVQKV